MPNITGRRERCRHCRRLVELTVTTYVPHGTRTVRWRGCADCFEAMVHYEQLRLMEVDQ